MKRYFPLLLFSVFVIVVTIAGTLFLDGYAGKQRPENIKKITVYTTLPVEQVSVLANEYERQFSIKVNIIPMPPADLLARITAEKLAPKGDLILADAGLLREAKKLEILNPYISEQTDIIPDRLKDKDSYWTGLWYDIFVFAINKDTTKDVSGQPLKWNDLVKGNFRLAMTDFLAADAASHLFFTFVSVQGEEQALQYLGKIHSKIVQYAKFLATPARMAGMGEVDIAVAVQSETLRYVQDGFPIKIQVPEDGTAYLLTGAALLKSSSAEGEAKHFIDWLLQNPAQQILSHNKFYFIPANPEIPAAKTLSSNNINMLEVSETLTAEKQKKLLDRWIQTVRLAPR